MKTFQNFRSDAVLSEAFITRSQALQAYAEGIADGSIRVCESCGSPNLFEIEKFGMTCVDCGNRGNGIVPVHEIQEPEEALQSGFDEAELDEMGGAGGGGGVGGGAGASGGAPGAGNGAGAGECTCTSTTTPSESCPVHGVAPGFYGDPSGDDYKRKKKRPMEY